MLLNERKIKILELIIDSYIQSAEPVGSRTIAKNYDLGVSSATIRNEMSDLEELGYIIQPHASAGRVPSNKGYRLYVDRLMQHRELTLEEINFISEIINQNINHMDYLIRETAKAISFLTNYTTIVSKPTVKKILLKRIQLIPLDENSIVVVSIDNNNNVRNSTLKTSIAYDIEKLNKLSLIITEKLCGVTLEEMDFQTIKDIFSEVDITNETLSLILSVLKIISIDEENRVYTTGVKNILEFPEFSNLDKAKEVFETLEEQNLLVNLFDNKDSDDVKIIIGEENSLKQLKNCSIIYTNYRLSDKSYGSVGIIGPTRMNYPQVVAILNAITARINKISMNSREFNGLL